MATLRSTCKCVIRFEDKLCGQNKFTNIPVRMKGLVYFKMHISIRGSIFYQTPTKQRTFLIFLYFKQSDTSQIYLL